MGCYSEEFADVHVEKVVKARTSHKCDACKLAIAPGHYYSRTSIVFEGTAETIKRCGACEATYQHLCKLFAENNDDMFPDEKLSCGLAYEDEWGPVPDEISRLAFLTDAERGALLKPVAP